MLAQRVFFQFFPLCFLGGFCIRLNDNADQELSEDENELEDDSISRISRSA